MSNQSLEACEQYGPDIAAYALGESQPSPELRAHLQQCLRCQQQLRDDRRVAAGMLVSVPEVAPSPALRGRLLAAAEAESRPSVGAKPRRTARPLRLGWLATAVAMLALLFWNVSLQQQLGQQRADLATSRANWQTMTQLLNAEKLAWYPLEGQQARGHFWLSPSVQAACLVVEGLPALPAGEVYQIWLSDGDQQKSGGMLTVSNGSGWKLVRDDQPESYSMVSVTIEPSGGSVAPSGQRVLAGELRQASVPTPAEWQHAIALIQTGD